MVKVAVQGSGDVSIRGRHLLDSTLGRANSISGRVCDLGGRAEGPYVLGAINISHVVIPIALCVRYRYTSSVYWLNSNYVLYG